MVRAWPLDYMHLVCLGVMRKLLFLLMADMDEESQNEYDRRMKIFTRRCPSEFQRKGGPLSLLGRWKATEYRLFMLYTGPFVFKGIISDASYNHFLQLHFAMSILLSLSLDGQQVDFARSLLRDFVQTFGVLYGIEQFIYNGHSLIHLPDDCDYFEVVDAIIASYLKKVTLQYISNNAALLEIFQV